MDIYLVIGIVGSVASIIGLVVAIIQTIRFRNASENVRMLKRHRNATIWSNISMLLEAYETLEDARNLVEVTEDLDPKLYAKISSARRSIVNQYLQYLKEAVLDEDDFTSEILDSWVKSGRLENEWRVNQARKFIGLNG